MARTHRPLARLHGLLLLCLALCLLTPAVSAAARPAASTGTTPAAAGGDPALGLAVRGLPGVPDGAREIPARRARNARTYADPRGTFTVRVTPGPQNYRDSTGAWQPIDDTLVPDGSGGYANRADAYAAHLQIIENDAPGVGPYATRNFVTTQTYDPRNLQLSWVQKQGTTIAHDYEYQYDANANRTQMAADATVPMPPTNPKTVLQYNPANELTTTAIYANRTARADQSILPVSAWRDMDLRHRTGRNSLCLLSALRCLPRPTT